MLGRIGLRLVSIVDRGFVLLPLVAAACASSLPSPEMIRHPARTFAEVPYPPPAALVEIVPDEPSDAAVWVDGYWSWRGSSYVWLRGGWLEPPEGAGYATWQLVLTDDGRLMFAPGLWYDASHREMPVPKMLAVARTPPNQITSESEAAR